MPLTKQNIPDIDATTDAVNRIHDRLAQIGPHDFVDLPAVDVALVIHALQFLASALLDNDRSTGTQ